MPTCPAIPRLPQEVLMRFRTMRDYDRQMFNYASGLCSVIPEPTDLSAITARLDAIEATLTAYGDRLTTIETDISFLQTAIESNITWIVVSDAVYTITDHNIGLLVNTASNAVLINLPVAADYEGETITIKDDSGSAGTNNITLQPNGTDTIDDDTVLVLDSDYAGVQIVSSGSGWEIV